ncbi:uncharacterized protein F5147DRAFT_658399 [Suillus discolor]|uniref:Uncharacterized protein n=1 Tax=Suillus discolor TaxID=1912936 RepID=A0A9P7JMM6_9AGAM|nr:uncharacterized protein F5147DRAFT_658399 [Suillus discolor]KAG2089448.1 hypothetical protein F5147DRAFT_658399 [Suillus discolor]
MLILSSSSSESESVSQSISDSESDQSSRSAFWYCKLANDKVALSIELRRSSRRATRGMITVGRGIILSVVRSPTDSAEFESEFEFLPPSALLMSSTSLMATALNHAPTPILMAAALNHAPTPTLMAAALNHAPTPTHNILMAAALNHTPTLIHNFPVVVITCEETETSSSALGKKLNLKELRLASEDLLADFFMLDKNSTSLLSLTSEMFPKVVTMIDASITSSSSIFALHWTGLIGHHTAHPPLSRSPTLYLHVFVVVYMPQKMTSVVSKSALMPLCAVCFGGFLAEFSEDFSEFSEALASFKIYFESHY